MRKGGRGSKRFDMLAPLAAIAWHGGGKDNAYVSISFDAAGRPVDALEGAEEVELAGPG